MFVHSTSPSIYLNFYSLSATNSCGPLGGGPKGIITSTLIAFAPGELSTLALPLNQWEHEFQPDLTKYSASYSFADLPCPPYDTVVNPYLARNRLATDLIYSVPNGISLSLENPIVPLLPSHRKS